ncbi:MAG: alpha/beta hydrolase [Acetobacteraceae bacterium]|nr:alpha/beta hydrolase [Acetobacteraceae bacterium]
MAVEWDRVPAIVRFADTAKFAETYGFAASSGQIALEGQYMLPRNSPSKTLYIFMHPAGTLQLLPMPMTVAASGLHVLCAASRYPKNDSALIMEKVAIDMGAWVRDGRARGYEKIILVGWSGGGALSLFYQAQAESPTIRITPAGDPADLVEAGLIPADGVIFIAAHLSRAETLTEWLDPSVIDEADPDRRDPDLDIYAPDTKFLPPYDLDFVARFRAGQIARSRRITAWCDNMLGRLKAPEVERAFVVHRTMCDVRWLDKTIDPNGRPEGRCYLGDPRSANVAPAGLARYTSLRSWLSQWSYERSQAKGPANPALIRHTPVLQIENGADDAVPASHNPTIRAALATYDKEFVHIKGASHYYMGQPERMAECLAALRDWSVRKNLLAA